MTYKEQSEIRYQAILKLEAKIQQLKKENAELKKTVEYYRKEREFFIGEVEKMTDEEMAEQYAVENWEHCEEGQTDYKAIKRAYLAGLKAGRPKWHNVAAGDLPKKEDLEM